MHLYNIDSTYFFLQAEKVGYFPAMVVQLISKSKKTRSLCSTGSQASVESELSGKFFDVIIHVYRALRPSLFSEELVLEPFK